MIIISLCLNVHQEDQHDIVLYQCDNYMSNWTQRCLRQADIVLVIGLASGDPELSATEMKVQQKKLFRSLLNHV